MFARPAGRAAIVVILDLIVAALINLATSAFDFSEYRWWVTGLVLCIGIWLAILAWRGVGGQPDVAPEVVVASRAEQRAASGRPWMAPFLNRRPIDRPELVAETLRLLAGATGQTIGVTTALHGAGGFGKTTLAALVCSRPEVRELFRGGLLWVTVGQEQHGPDLAARVNDLCEHLTGERPSFSDPEQAGHRLGQLLDDGPPTLLVVDDVWDAAQLRPFLLGGKQATRLVTTRIPGLLPDTAETVRVDQMRQIESKDLLNANLPPLPAHATQKLLSITGRWPLLLAMVNAALRRSLRDGIPLGKACDSLIRQLSDQGPSSLDVSVEQRRDRAVHLTVQVSLSLLPEASRQRYLELGIFGEDVDIPPDMLEALWGATGGMAPGPIAKLCNDLSELSLVAIYHRDIGTIRLHDVIRLYLRHQCGDERLSALNALLLREARRALPVYADASGGAEPWWLLPDQAEYLWRQVCYHLAEARQTAELVSLVCDLRWVAEKGRRYDVAAVEADLHRVDDPTAATLRATLAREAHTLTPITPGHSYPALLMSRLDGAPELAPLLVAYRASLSTTPRLENRWLPPDRHPSVVRVLAGHDSFVTDCAVAPNGAWVVSAGSDATALVWSTATGQTQLTLSGHRGQVLGCTVSTDGLWIATAGEDGTVRVWDSSTGTQTLVINLTEPATACAISPNGEWLVAIGARGGARMWRLSSGAPGPALVGHTDRVNRCAIAATGDWIVTCGNDGRAMIWDTTTGERRRTLSGHSGPVSACAVSVDASLIVTGGWDGTLRLWHATDGRCLGVLDAHRDRITSCAISHDGRWLMSASWDGTARTWDTANQQCRSVLAGHSERLSGCSIAPDDSWVVTASWDGTARIWDATGHGDELFQPSGAGPVNACAASADGRFVVTGHQDGTAAVRRAADGSIDDVVSQHTTAVHGCAVAPDGSWLVTASSDGTARVWDLVQGQTRYTLSGHLGSVSACVIAPDGSWIATTSNDHTARIWDSRDGREMHLLANHGNWVSACAVSQDGKLLATGSWDETAQVWEAATGRLLQCFVHHVGPVLGCSFSRAGDRLATAAGDGKVRIIDVRTGQLILSFTGGVSGLTACAFSPGDDYLATTSSDGVLRIWRPDTGENIASMRVNGALNAACWTPDGGLCVSGAGGAYLFDFRFGEQASVIPQPRQAVDGSAPTSVRDRPRTG